MKNQFIHMLTDIFYQFLGIAGRSQISLHSRQTKVLDLPIDTLSMGMSHDYDAAIEEGATMVRVGTAIFGPRNLTGGQQNG